MISMILYLHTHLKKNIMTPSKKQILEVTKLANQLNINVDKALAKFKNCSQSIYKTIGAKGLIECLIEVDEVMESDRQGGIALSKCTIEKVSEKALLVNLPTNNGLSYKSKWIAKSIINNDIIPYWATK
jgi:hypothetical protein